MFLVAVWWIIVVLAMAQGLVMLIRPHVYVGFCNRWYSLFGYERQITPEKLERWPARLGGLGMVLTGAYLLWVITH